MSDDLLTRLRMCTQVAEFELRLEAAREIERLRAALKAVEAMPSAQFADHTCTDCRRPAGGWHLSWCPNGPGLVLGRHCNLEGVS